MRYTVEMIEDTSSDALLWQEWQIGDDKESCKKVDEEVISEYDPRVERLAFLMATDAHRQRGVSGGMYSFDDRVALFVTLDEQMVEPQYLLSFLTEFAPALLALYEQEIEKAYA